MPDQPATAEVPAPPQVLLYVHVQSGWVGQWQLDEQAAHDIRTAITDYWRDPDNYPRDLDRHLGFGEGPVVDTWIPLAQVALVQIFPLAEQTPDPAGPDTGEETS